MTRQAVSAWEKEKSWPDSDTLAKLNGLMGTDFAKPLPVEVVAPPSDGLTVLLILIAVLVPVIGWVGPIIILSNRRLPRWSKIAAIAVMVVEFVVIGGILLLSLWAWRGW